MKKSYSQMGQDLWVLDVLSEKKNGTFVDIGCATPFFLSNTSFLETEYNWRGVGIDLTPFNGTYYDHYYPMYPDEIKNDPSMRSWDTRKNTRVYEADATSFDYLKCFQENNLPPIIDYLNVDLEPPNITLQAFLAIPHDKYKFRTITFEHDSYRAGTSWLDHTREIISSYGYKLVKTVDQDDYYIMEE